MNYFNDKNPWSGVAVLADYQFAGVGRENNEWVSPKGSLSLTFGFDLDFVKGIWLHILYLLTQRYVRSLFLCQNHFSFFSETVIDGPNLIAVL